VTGFCCTCKQQRKEDRKKVVQTERRIDGGRREGGRMDRRTDGRREDGRTDGGREGRRTDRLTDRERLDGQTDGGMDRWMEGGGVLHLLVSTYNSPPKGTRPAFKFTI